MLDNGAHEEDSPFLKSRTLVLEALEPPVTMMRPSASIEVPGQNISCCVFYHEPLLAQGLLLQAWLAFQIRQLGRKQMKRTMRVTCLNEGIANFAGFDVIDRRVGLSIAGSCPTVTLRELLSAWALSAQASTKTFMEPTPRGKRNHLTANHWTRPAYCRSREVMPRQQEPQGK